ncbi:hypothetical protein P43SY_005088 [Pythium insidiosum]|uniref:Transmembrane protein n=1 Tax=Pythium insidiosum TaxID=114742 RepID=A0AAD5M1K9_PYTIN|nr:hypothetical protein P43SY_005088 [Pythium insidiosum]
MAKRLLQRQRENALSVPLSPSLTGVASLASKSHGIPATLRRLSSIPLNTASSAKPWSCKIKHALGLKSAHRDHRSRTLSAPAMIESQLASNASDPDDSGSGSSEDAADTDAVLLQSERCCVRKGSVVLSPIHASPSIVIKRRLHIPAGSDANADGHSVTSEPCAKLSSHAGDETRHAAGEPHAASSSASSAASDTFAQVHATLCDLVNQVQDELGRERSRLLAMPTSAVDCPGAEAAEPDGTTLVDQDGEDDDDLFFDCIAAHATASDCDDESAAVNAADRRRASRSASSSHGAVAVAFGWMIAVVVTGCLPGAIRFLQQMPPMTRQPSSLEDSALRRALEELVLVTHTAAELDQAAEEMARIEGESMVAIQPHCDFRSGSEQCQEPSARDARSRLVAVVERFLLGLAVVLLAVAATKYHRAMKIARFAFISVAVLALLAIAQAAESSNRYPKRKPVKSVDEIIRETQRRISERHEL